MQPAFHTQRHLAGWIFGLILLSVMPLLLPRLVPVEVRYLTASRRTGPSDWLTNIALRDRGELDVLFVGGSDILTNIDHAVLAEEFRKRGVNLRSATVGMTWDNEDFAYYYLKDLFKTRKVKVVVLALHNRQPFPHSATKYIHRFDAADPELKLVSAGLAITNYAEMSLISLRLIEATLIRPGKQMLEGYRFWKDVGEHEEKNHGTWLARVDYSSATTVDEARIKDNAFTDAPIITPIEGYAVARAGEKLPPGLTVDNRELGVFEKVYYPAIKKLCDDNHAVLLFSKQPIPFKEQTSMNVPVAALELGVPLLFAPTRAIFGEAPSETLKKYYYNDGHFNANGAKQNAFAIAPPLLTFVNGNAQ